MTGCITTFWKLLCNSASDSTPVHHLYVNTSRSAVYITRAQSMSYFLTTSWIRILHWQQSSVYVNAYDLVPYYCPIQITFHVHNTLCFPQPALFSRQFVQTYNVCFVSSCSTAELHVPYNYHETHTDGH